MENCVFCNIVKGKIPERIILENEDFLVFLSKPAMIRGHTLVIPKKHYRWIWEMGDREYTNLMLMVKLVANILKRAFGTEIVMEFISGTEVPHVHVHLIPRVKGDGVPEIPREPLSPQPSEEEMNHILKKIRKNIFSQDF
jgi:histidine triad (HIT) family protein